MSLWAERRSDDRWRTIASFVFDAGPTASARVPPAPTFGWRQARQGTLGTVADPCRVLALPQPLSTLFELRAATALASAHAGGRIPKPRTPIQTWIGVVALHLALLLSLQHALRAAPGHMADRTPSRPLVQWLSVRLPFTSGARAADAAEPPALRHRTKPLLPPTESIQAPPQAAVEAPAASPPLPEGPGATAPTSAANAPLDLVLRPPRNPGSGGHTPPSTAEGLPGPRPALTLEDRIARATGSNGPWVEERIDPDTVRLRRGGECVVLRRTRAAVLDPMATGGRTAPWQVDAPKPC